MSVYYKLSHLCFICVFSDHLLCNFSSPFPSLFFFTVSFPMNSREPSNYSATIWLTIWFFLNIAVTLMNKAFFKWWNFLFPITLSMIHMLCSAAGSWLVLYFGKYEQQKLSFAEQVPVILFSFLFCANIVVGNSSLRYVTVSLSQVVRSVIPGITLLLSVAILGKSYHKAYYYIIGKFYLRLSFGYVKSISFSFFIILYISLLYHFFFYPSVDRIGRHWCWLGILWRSGLPFLWLSAYLVSLLLVISQKRHGQQISYR